RGTARSCGATHRTPRSPPSLPGGRHRAAHPTSAHRDIPGTGISSVSPPMVEQHRFKSTRRPQNLFSFLDLAYHLFFPGAQLGREFFSGIIGLEIPADFDLAFVAGRVWTPFDPFNRLLQGIALPNPV